MPKMHYFPAALIGEFSDDRSAGRRRERPVWIARRSAPRVFPAAAKAGGIDPDEPTVYRGPDRDDRLDRLWQRTETMTGAFSAACEQAAREQALPAEQFIRVMVPYVAHLLARHPALDLGGWTSLGEGQPSHVDGLDRRGAASVRYLDALTYKRRWRLAEVSPPQYLVGTDIGWHRFPGPWPGELFLPVSPTRALVVDGGRPSYQHGADIVPVPLVQWTSADIDLRRDVMMLSAPREVYANTEEHARRALDLWRATGTVSVSPAVAALVAHPPGSTAWMNEEGAAAEPADSMVRYLAAHHRFGCDCEALMRAANVPWIGRRILHWRQHRSERRAVRGVRGEVTSEARRSGQYAVGLDEAHCLVSDSLGRFHSEPLGEVSVTYLVGDEAPEA